MTNFFTYNSRLGIPLPVIRSEWEKYEITTQQSILVEWERIRGRIPDRIKEVEDLINKKQEQLNHEEDFKLSCQLNNDIADLASVINDLWIWYRTNQNVSREKVHH